MRIDTTPEILQQVAFTESDWGMIGTPAYTQRLEQAFGASALRRIGGDGLDVRGRQSANTSTDRLLPPGERPLNEPRPQVNPLGGAVTPARTPPTDPLALPDPNAPRRAPSELLPRPGAGQADPALTPPRPDFLPEAPRRPGTPPPGPSNPRIEPGPPGL